MVNIKCTVTEKYHFLKIIKYCKQKRIDDFKSGKITQKHLDVDLESLEMLEDRVNGIYHEDYQDVSAKSYRRQFKAEKEDLPHLDFPYLW